MQLGAYRNTIVISGLWFITDGLFLNQGLFSILWLLLSAPVLLVLLVWGKVRDQRKKPSNWRMKAAKVLVFSLAAACVLVSIRLNNDMAGRRAERLATACEQFNAKYHRYPHKLEELVPEFLPAVPLAKYVLNGQSAHFVYLEGDRTIMFYDVPPFGRSYYHLGSRWWGHMD